MKKNLYVYLLSDTIVSVAVELSRMVLTQYPGVDATFHQDSFIHTPEQCEDILKKIDPDHSIILFTFLSEDLNHFVLDYCRKYQMSYLDLVTPLEKTIITKTGESPIFNKNALSQRLDENYFNRIDAIEFAVQYDDGQDPKGFLEAEIILLGVSRTSKTPLSMYLANQNYKVANLPLLPNTPLPKELWEVPSSKIVGLTSEPDVLASIRKERMISYGVNEDNPYSNLEKIRKELKFAEMLYQQLNCLVINVASKSIEETASIITNILEPAKNN